MRRGMDGNKHGGRGEGQEQLQAVLLLEHDLWNYGISASLTPTDIKIFKSCFWTSSVLGLMRATASLFITLLTDRVFNTSTTWQDSVCDYLCLMEHLAPSTATQYETSGLSKSCELQTRITKSLTHRAVWLDRFLFFPLCEYLFQQIYLRSIFLLFRTVIFKKLQM